jgi:hypothetical protein
LDSMSLCQAWYRTLPSWDPHRTSDGIIKPE